MDGFTFKQESSECPVAFSAANVGTNFGINSFLELFFLLVSVKNFGESTKISRVIQLIFLGPYNQGAFQSPEAGELAKG